MMLTLSHPYNVLGRHNQLSNPACYHGRITISFGLLTLSSSATFLPPALPYFFIITSTP